PPGIPEPGRKRRRRIRRAIRPQTPAGTSSGRGRWRAHGASQCSDGPPLAQPFGRTPYVVNPTEMFLFRPGAKIFVGNGAEPVGSRDGRRTRGTDVLTFVRPFPSRGPHTRDASDYPVPRRSCNARFGAPIWNGFLRVGQSR